MFYIILATLAAFLSALLCAFLFTPVAAKAGTRFGAVDRPNARKVHSGAIPRTGGLAIIASFLLGHFLLIMTGTILGHFTPNWILCGLFLGGAFFAVGIGITDDFKRIPSSVKLLMQILAATIAFQGGIRVETFGVFEMSWHFSVITSYLLTVFWFVLFMNAVNLIDGLDGLAAGVAVFSSAVMAALMIIAGNEKGALAFAAIAGAALGFLRYNFNPAKVFMGDGGSYFLGYALAFFSISYGAKSQVGLSLLIPLIALGLPIFDVIVSTLRRFITGKKIFKADRGHIHHRLLARGLTTKKAVLVLYGITSILALSTLVLVNLRSGEVGIIFLFLGIGAIVFIRKLGYFEYLAFDKLFGWLHDIRDVSGFTHDRRAFLGVEINIRESQTLDEMWQHVCKALEMKGFLKGYLVLNNSNTVLADSSSFPHGGIHLHPVGHSESDENVIGERIWTYSPQDQNKRYIIPQEWKFEMTTPLLNKHKTSFGILYLTRDLRKHPFTAHTMRRIESLRRSLVVALEKLERQSGVEKKRVGKGEGKARFLGRFLG